MQTLEILAFIPIKRILEKNYCAIASDGCYIYLLNPGGAVSRFTFQMEFIKSYYTDKIYQHLCYDPQERCFWAWSKKYKHTVFKLDTCFEAIGALKIPEKEGCHCCVRGIGLNPDRHCLIINYGTVAVEINKHCPEDSRRLSLCSANCQMKCVYYSDERYYSIEEKEGDDSLCVYAPDNEMLMQCHFPRAYTLQGLIAVRCNGYAITFILARRDGCYDYIIPCRMKDFCSSGNSKTDQTYDESGDCFKHPLKWKDCCDPCCCRDGCGYDYFDCDHRCHHCDCGHGSHHSGNCSLHRSCTDIIESIALIETALSHILNAEGEKIQKVLSQAETTEEILEINNSVRSTITKITHLEHVLYAKLDLAIDVCESRDHQVLGED